MLNNKGSVSIVCMYICSYALFLSIIVNSIFMENYYYYKKIQTANKLELIENAIISKVYNDTYNVNYSSSQLSFSSKLKKQNDDLVYTLKLYYKKEIYTYSIKYDIVCNRIIEFVNTSTIKNL